MSQLLAQHTADVNHAYGERQHIFPPDDYGCGCVCLSAWCAKVQQSQGKTHHPNVSQCRLGLGAAQGVCETSA